MAYFRMNPPTNVYHFTIALAWFAVAGLMFYALGESPLTDIDEGAFAEASREMLAKGDWVSPWLYDSPRFDKPVLIHWLQIISFLIFGQNTWSARLPSVLAGLAWVAVMSSWARLLAKRIYNEPNHDSAYFWTLVFSGTSIGILAISRASTADALLNALLAFSLLALWKAFHGEGNGSARLWARVCAVTIGLGLITKGPIALLVPSVGVIFAALSRSYCGMPRLKQLFSDPVNWALLLTISVPWYWLQYQAQGMAFFNSFFGDHNLRRFTSTMHGLSAGIWYYPVWISVALLPGSILAFRIFQYFFRHKLWRERSLWMCWGVFAFVILFFSLSATKLPHYSFYGLSGALVIAGVVFSRITLEVRETKQTTFFPERIFFSLIFAGLALLPVWWINIVERTTDPYIRNVLLTANTIFGHEIGWFIFAGIIAIFILLIRHIYSLAISFFVFSLIVLFGVAVPIMSAMRTPIYNAAQVVKLVQEPVITWRLAAPSLSFAAERVIRPGEPHKGIFVVLHSKDQDSLDTALKNHADGAMRGELRWEQGGIRIVYVQ